MGAHFANCVFSSNYKGLGTGSASAAGHGRARGGHVGRGETQKVVSKNAPISSTKKL